MSPRFELECTDCSVRETVDGEFADVFADVDVHREDRDAGCGEHFVNVHRRS